MKIENIQIRLECKQSRDEAMRHVLNWANNYSGPKSPEEVIRDCFDHWPDLYHRRIRVLDSLLCCSGGNYGWLDGGLIDTAPEDWLKEKPAPMDPKELPLPDDGRSYKFYLDTKYSNIFNIPKDVSKKWLELCLECAVLIRDRSTDIQDVELGAKLVKQIQAKLSTTPA